MDEIKKTFERYDKDKNGYISYKVGQPFLSFLLSLCEPFEVNGGTTLSHTNYMYRCTFRILYLMDYVYIGAHQVEDQDVKLISWQGVGIQATLALNA